MHLTKIVAQYNGETGSLYVTTYQFPECTESQNSYLWKGKRVPKSDVGKVDTTIASNTSMALFYRIWSFPGAEDVAANTLTLKAFMLRQITALAHANRKLVETAEKVLVDPQWVEKAGRLD